MSDTVMDMHTMQKPGTGFKVPVKRCNYLHIVDNFNLNQACISLVHVYGQHIYLVGSVLTRLDYRDVDVRCILSDEVYDKLYPVDIDDLSTKKYKKFIDISISEWLASCTGLKIDFQIQRRTEANQEFDGQRSALGLIINEP